MREQGTGQPDPAGPAADDPERRLLTGLYLAHAAAVRRFVAPYLSDAHRVDDVVQETFLRAWRHIDHIDPERNPRAFLFTTARRVLVDQWRAQGRRPEALPGGELTPEPAEDGVAKTLETILINESLRKLSHEHREVINALYFDELTVAEAADRFGVAVGTIKSRSYYAVRALRSAFDEMGLLR